MNILAISGSLRAKSSNTAILQAASTLAPAGMKVSFYEGIGGLPHFNPDIDGDEPPAAVREWRQQLQSADGVLICTPEYANGVPGVLKNALDWIVSSGEFMNKRTAVISASPMTTGGEKAHDSLLLTLGMLTAKITCTMKVAMVSKKLDPAGAITDDALEQEIRRLMDGFTD
ncbi:NADPH-dependent FMN reductase [Paenibacillus sp. GCM10027628]|uniref:NADPH-dependent FMN reductase n=1 Tax=Paenibacillus sp. GCM10027628 TaxID=3273413 RepID=UPI00362D89FF